MPERASEHALPQRANRSISQGSCKRKSDEKSLTTRMAQMFKHFAQQPRKVPADYRPHPLPGQGMGSEPTLTNARVTGPAEARNFRAADLRRSNSPPKPCTSFLIGVLGGEWTSAYQA